MWTVYEMACFLFHVPVLAAFLAACASFDVVVDVPVVRFVDVGVQFLDKVVTCPLLCMSYSSC